MKITMLDTVETAHTIIPELEQATQIKAQTGLRILSEARAVAGGLSGINYVLLISKGARVEVPARLAKRLVEIGHASK